MRSSTQRPKRAIPRSYTRKGCCGHERPRAHCYRRRRGRVGRHLLRGALACSHAGDCRSDGVARQWRLCLDPGAAGVPGARCLPAQSSAHYDRLPHVRAERPGNQVMSNCCAPQRGTLTMWSMVMKVRVSRPLSGLSVAAAIAFAMPAIPLELPSPRTKLFALCLCSNPGARGVPFRAPQSTRSLPILLAVAADTLINPVVLLFDPAVEGRSGRALRLARMGYRLSRRSQKLLVQQSRGLVAGRRANASGTVHLSLSREGSDGGHEQQTKIQPFQHWILLSAKR